MSDSALTIEARDGSGSFTAYMARPNGTPRAAIIVIQEIFGVNAGIRQKCDTLAAAGYLAVAPDLFWRLEPGFEADADVEAEFKAALDMMMRYNQDKGVADIQAAIDAARAHVGGDSGRVGCVGYCLGGRLAFMAATRTNVDASVCYYGVGIDNLLGESHAIANPVMLHIPTNDGFVGPEVQAAMHAGLDDHAKVTLHDYEGLDHGFAAEMGARRDVAAAELADSRTMAFFAEHLG